MSVSNIQCYFEDIKPVNLNKKYLNSCINYLILNELKEIGEISVVFCSDDYLLKMNEQYLNHDYYTDIITFDYVENSLISGDLFISIDRVKENAIKFAAPFIKELYRVVFHGVLHLVGYKDKTSEEKAEMRNKEDFYLKMVDFSEEGL